VETRPAQALQPKVRPLGLHKPRACTVLRAGNDIGPGTRLGSRWGRWTGGQQSRAATALEGQAGLQKLRYGLSLLLAQGFATLEPSVLVTSSDQQILNFHAYQQICSHRRW
jgi:hypothetical protein